MSRENKWERRHTEEDERPSGRWKDEAEGKEGVRNDRRRWGGGGEKRGRKSGLLRVYINPLQRRLLPSYL